MARKYQSIEKILATPAVTWQRLGCVVLLAWLVGLFFLHSEVGKEISYHFSERPLYQIREQSGHAPTLSEKLKIFVVDDSVFEHIESWPVPIETWSQLLTHIHSKKPAKIIVDGVFKKYRSEQPEAFNHALQKFKDMQPSLVVGGYVTQKQVSKQSVDYAAHLLSLEDVKYDKNHHNFMRKFSVPSEFAVFPHADLLASFGKVGHAVYDLKTKNRIKPFYILGEKYVFPRFAFYAADSLIMQNNQFYVNRKRVPLGHDGTLLINAPKFKDLHKAAAVFPLHDTALMEEAFADIKEGDTVLVIPGFFTGSSDFQPIASHDAIPGGFIVASLVNSVLTHQWVGHLPNQGLLCFLFAILGTVIAVVMSPWLAVVVTLISAAVMTLCSFLTFSWLSMLPPTIAFLGCFLSAAAMVTVRKVLLRDKKVRLLKYALEGHMPVAQLNKVLSSVQNFNVQPRQEVATVMFIDMVGFSLTVERSLPRRAFERLKATIDDITDIIHKYDGVINKTIGDGILAVFGLTQSDATESTNHALNALKCALEIQQMNVEKVVELNEANQRISLLLRIGVNTGPLFIGNLGKGERLDLGLIGNSVNMAKRFETECSLFRVLVGESTHELAKIASLDYTDFKQRFVKVKHHVNMIPAWEYNPFKLNPQLVKDAEAALIENKDHIDRKRRWQFFKGAAIHVQTSLGKAQLINFSYSGLCLKFKTELKDSQLLELFPPSLQVGYKKEMQDLELEKIQVKVKWLYDDGDGTVCGVQMLGLNDKQVNRFIVSLCDIHDQVVYGDAV